MVNLYFSEKELGKKKLDSEDISCGVYNGIVALFKKYDKCFAKDFPIYCDDSDGVVCGVNYYLLNSAIKAEIPDMEIPIAIKQEEDFDIDKYAILDYIEFCYSRMKDYQENDYHSYFKHYHYSFKETGLMKDEFRNEANRIFERNGIIFYLDQDGSIKRHLPIELEVLIENINTYTSDSRLNELINISTEYIKSPKEEKRTLALEKIWDAFERMKTYYTEKNKKQSSEQLVSKVSNGTDGFKEIIDEEFKILTNIGNKYQIRHFETNKIQICNLEHVDYLFYRMIVLINLCLNTINKK